MGRGGGAASSEWRRWHELGGRILVLVRNEQRISGAQERSFCSPLFRDGSVLLSTSTSTSTCKAKAKATTSSVWIASDFPICSRISSSICGNTTLSNVQQHQRDFSSASACPSRNVNGCSPRKNSGVHNKSKDLESLGSAKHWSHSFSSKFSGVFVVRNYCCHSRGISTAAISTGSPGCGAEQPSSTPEIEDQEPVFPIFPSHNSLPAFKAVRRGVAGVSIANAVLEPSISGRTSAVRLSFVASWDSPKLTHWFQSHGDMSDPRVLGGILANSGTQMLGVSVISGTLPGPGTGNADRKGCNWSSQVRRVSSSSWKLFPRTIEKPRYSGRPLDREDSAIHAQRQARFDENFKRLPAVKLPLGEYRQKIVDNSTKNMALVPKKWKRALPSREVMDAVLYLRRAKTNKDEVKEVIRKRVARMLKLEMMLVLSELQRLDEFFLAHQVFNAVRKESWYKPNVYLYQTMVETFGKSKQIKDAERMFEELQSEGLQPDDSIKRELLRAYVKCDMMTEAIKLYKEIQKSGPLDRAARSILFHGLSEEQKVELAAYEKAQGYNWS
ncbi:unnamed protein product [Calypogeia fissa]